MIACALRADSAEVRLKDISRIEGVRPNQLVGQGLVVGLNATGDRNGLLSGTELSQVLDRLGQSASPALLKSRNAAVVILTATLPPFARSGTAIDVLVSSVLDAQSLEGGVLVQAPLLGADGLVHAVAQGSLVVGGFTQQANGENVQRNVPTVAVIPGGALVERDAGDLDASGAFRLVLDQDDFATASSAATALRRAYGSGVARVLDARTLEVAVPERWLSRVPEFMSEMGKVSLHTDTPARVVVNERTGTVVVGEDVRVSEVAVAHGNLSVAVSSTPLVSQPAPFGRGQTVVTADTSVQVTEESPALQVLPTTASLKDLVAALNALGASPRDVMAILQALRAAGALHAELVVM
jgi:flagellar P-ring protein precursor FlgI